MKIRSITLAFSAGAIAGCMAGGAPSGAQSPAPPPSSSSAAPERRAGALDIGTPLVIDRMDTRIGTTVQFDRIPNASELHDATEVPGLAHVVLSLDGWPTDFAPLQGLDQLPEGADMIVVIPGYPPSTAVAQIWNYLNTRVRIVVVVPGPPPSPALIAGLNTLRGLERVIVQNDDPSRAGFEYLQRPLGFRKLVR
ncbi:MAG: hypothetical protein HYR74_01725 [Candidatus Eisenbacteria bacterium]|nr:hypothetical protein [Candidatus Eisenbacteria bacterium]